MSMVHASRGGLKPASEHLKSEPAIIAALALATLPNTRVAWTELVSDYGKIRDSIEAIFPDFADFNAEPAATAPQAVSEPMDAQGTAASSSPPLQEQEPPRRRSTVREPAPFLIGGATGLPPAWRDQGGVLLSLSEMTMPHELARAVVAEQIYRAFTILRGHPYPR